MAVLMCVVSVSSCKKNGADTEEPIVADNTPVEHADVPARPPKGCGGAAMSIHYGDAYKTLREAEEYKPGLRDYYVSELNDRRNEYFLASISANQRKEWVGSHGFKDKDLQCFLPIFEATSAAAKKTLPKYRPRGYTHHDSGEDALIREAVKAELPDAEFIGVGVKSPTWEIEKHNNGVPSARYKYGMAWVKSATFDDGFCRIAYVNILGDYAGGGNYADSKGSFINFEPAGCK